MGLIRSCLRPYGGAAADRPETSPEGADETLGHSFCYVRSSSPAHSRSSSAAGDIAGDTAFRTISGAAVSANSSASVPVLDPACAGSRPPEFRSSASFSTIPLQLAAAADDRGFFFLSALIERGALSGPVEPDSGFFRPIPKRRRRQGLRRIWSMSDRSRQWVAPLRPIVRRCGLDHSAGSPAVQWAHGKAGEDRVHAVVSEEHRWLFVGIYDGFNDPDAPEFLMNNLYPSVFAELRGLFWEEDVEEAAEEEAVVQKRVTFQEEPNRRLWEFLEETDEDAGIQFSGSGRFPVSLSKLRHGLGSWRKEGGRIRFLKWRYDSDEKVRVIGKVAERALSKDKNELKEMERLWKLSCRVEERTN